MYVILERIYVSIFLLSTLKSIQWTNFPLDFASSDTLHTYLPWIIWENISWIRVAFGIKNMSNVCSGSQESPYWLPDIFELHTVVLELRRCKCFVRLTTLILLQICLSLWSGHMLPQSFETKCSGRSMIFQTETSNLNLLLDQFFLENCMKIKEIGLPVGRFPGALTWIHQCEWAMCVTCSPFIILKIC